MRALVSNDKYHVKAVIEESLMADHQNWLDRILRKETKTILHKVLKIYLINEYNDDGSLSPIPAASFANPERSATCFGFRIAIRSDVIITYDTYTNKFDIVKSRYTIIPSGCKLDNLQDIVSILSRFKIVKLDTYNKLSPYSNVRCN